MVGGTSSGTSLGRKPFALWVIAGGLVYAALALLLFVAPFITSLGLGFAGFLLAFIIVFLVAAFFTLREKRWAYILGSAAGIILTLLFSVNLVTSASNPADSGFWFVMSVLPALFLVVLFSILSFRNTRTGLAQKRYLASPQSTGGLLTVAVIGFVIGSLVAGAIGASVLLNNSAGASADIQIVPNAASMAMAFSPQSFHVAIGGTVTWINKDTTSHTVTSNTTGLFGSPLLTPTTSWSHVFTQAGTFYYHCEPHPLMWGVIVVS
jgi:plastocyanin